ncbi:MAG: globin [Spongiibacteraceae bacterium]
MSHSGQIESASSCISESLILLSEVGDITPAVYREFLRNCPDALPVTRELSQIVLGRMLGEILYAFEQRPLNPGIVDSYLYEEAITHAPFGVTLTMYRCLIAALLTVIAHELGTRWPDYEVEWHCHAEAMLRVIKDAIAPI